jgi:hypothetical protein
MQDPMPLILMESPPKYTKTGCTSGLRFDTLRYFHEAEVPREKIQ